MPASVPLDTRTGSAPGTPAGTPGRLSRPRRMAAICAAALVALAAGACTEQLETTAVCPELCPEQDIQVEQITLRPVVLDTTLAGFPLIGNEPYLALIIRGDSLETRAALRFDDLPRYRRTGTGSDSALITTVVDPVLQLIVARRLSDFSVPLTLEAFDIAHSGADTSTAAVLPLFNPSRLLGSTLVDPRSPEDTVSVDTVRVPLDADALVGKIADDERLRIGLRISGATSANLVITHNAAIQFRTVADTAAPLLVVTTSSDTPVGEPVLQNDLRSYSIVAEGSPPPPPQALSVGGLPARRSVLRFDIPSSVLDSTRIVRATLVLTQRPVRGFVPKDTLTVLALPVLATSVVTDVGRIARLAANPRNSLGNEVVVVPPVRIAPGDSGEVEISLANLVSLWSAGSDLGVQHALVLASNVESISPLRASFFSSEAPAGLQPVLRLSFIRRVNFDLP